jgi:beta-mannosidase
MSERKRLDLSWTVGHHTKQENAPEKWIPAQVPGAVQLDWARSENKAPHWYAENFRDYDWCEDVFWTYQTTLPQLELSENQRAFWLCGGVDYQFEILVGGEIVHRQEGMFAPVEIELLPEHSGQELLVRIFPAPKLVPEPRSRYQASHSVKPAVSYGWDWHPRLIPLGIWDETFVEIRPASFIQRAEVFQNLNDDFSRANLRFEIETSRVLDTLIRWRVLVDNDRVVHEQTFDASQNVVTCEIENPQLWWPHDQGEPHLYRSEVELIENNRVLDSHSQKFGIKRVRLVMHEGAWDWPNTFPKTRSNPPITLEINGRAIFCKGSNYVNPDIFPGAVEENQLRELVRLARDANMNIFRMWGGAPMQKKAFYDACDEMGVMVWQEFPLACNPYPDDDDYLRVLDRESQAMIRRLRGHASLVFWCGGNELYNSWSGMTDQSLPLRLLNKNCFELDRARPYLPTSPVMGMAHGGYFFYDVDNGEEGWEQFQRSSFTAYTEFGCPGPSPVEVLKTFIPENQLFPPRPGTSWESHHAFGVWMENSWLCLDVIEKYFGVSESLEQLVARGELLQCEGYKGLFEEARRQKPRSSMALNWCFNEAWPCAANNSLICWPAKPKPALKAVGDACRPTLLSARIPKFEWREGENFEAELWVLSDAPQGHVSTHIEAVLLINDCETTILTWQSGEIETNKNLRGPKVQIALPEAQGQTFELHLRCAEHPDWNSVYTLCFKPRVAKKEFHGDRLNF